MENMMIIEMEISMDISSSMLTTLSVEQIEIQNGWLSLKIRRG